MHIPASMVSPDLIAYMPMPSHQGNVPALASSAGPMGVHMMRRHRVGRRDMGKVLRHKLCH
eukprot:2808204-Prorocentrum_lima.AAC.1